VWPFFSANARRRLRSRYAELGVHAAATLVTVGLSRRRNPIDQPVEMEPYHARVPADERDQGEKEDVGHDKCDDDVPAGREPDREHKERKHGDAERIARDHGAGPVAGLALEPEPAHRTRLVHREHPAPDTALQAPRATAAADRPDPTHA